MSVKYVPVQWNRNKYIYNAVFLAAMVAFLWVYMDFAAGMLDHDRAINPNIAQGRAFGAAAFVALSLILCIGPLARLDRRFLVLLYNRRHLGVMTAGLALTHAYFLLGWYFAFRQGASRWETLLWANTSYTQILGFPFEALGIFALIVLLLLAVTSHDFWLKFLTPPVWKSLHLMIYPAYIAAMGHVGLGALQSREHALFSLLFIGLPVLVGALHLAAFWREREATKPSAEEQGWVKLGSPDMIAEGRARILRLADGSRVAVFRQDNQLSAISNACAHQNGPLGEGRIIDCLVTCPWHGFQYDVRTGQSPAPFTEKVPTYNLRYENGEIWVDPRPNPPGTPTEAVPVPPLPDVAEDV